MRGNKKIFVRISKSRKLFKLKKETIQEMKELRALIESGVKISPSSFAKLVDFYQKKLNCLCSRGI